jgi:hypothetical protein
MHGDRVAARVRRPQTRLERAANPRGLEPGAGFRPGTVPGILNRFPIVLNSRNCFKIPKFVETCRNI